VDCTSADEEQKQDSASDRGRCSWPPADGPDCRDTAAAVDSVLPQQQQGALWDPFVVVQVPEGQDMDVSPAADIVRTDVDPGVRQKGLSAMDSSRSACWTSPLSGSAEVRHNRPAAAAAAAAVVEAAVDAAFRRESP
jgi:hypothetical protein